MAQEGQPGGTTGVLSRRLVMGEDPSNHVLLDLDVERQGDLLGDSRTAPVAIHDQELVPEEKRLRNYGTGAARSE